MFFVLLASETMLIRAGLTYGLMRSESVALRTGCSLELSMHVVCTPHRSVEAFFHTRNMEFFGEVDTLPSQIRNQSTVYSFYDQI
ncbi:hypothetical protein KC19_VG079000 [Ceratodon purpureus]|uniref:Secreted protein n=1 Tax=Ceratodon purpureus TaxID=3225 RepID=A0A8T0HN45_CERPU|nr:hypothetical protein KC19_VG079000 [Ceratodon purpureus]